MIREGQTLTRTNDDRLGQAHVGAVGCKAVYKVRTSLDTTSCRRHAPRGLGRCRESTWLNTDRGSYSCQHALEHYRSPGKNTFSRQVVSSLRGRTANHVECK